MIQILFIFYFFWGLVAMMSRVVLIFSCLFLLTACPSKKKSGPNPYYRKVVLLGDPIKMTEGAQFSLTNFQESFSSTARNFDRVSLTGMISFEEYGEYTNKPYQILEENAPSSEDESEILSIPVYGLRASDDAISMSIWLNPSEAYNFVFTKKGEEWLYTISDSEDLLSQGQLLHFSESADKKNFSLLLYGMNSGGLIKNKPTKELLALYFSKNMVKRIPGSDWRARSYYYLLGPGVKVRWSRSEPLQLDICGVEDQVTIESVYSAARQWQGALGPRLELKINLVSSYLPFSDLNQQCFYLVDAYKADAHPQKGALGFVYTVIDQGQGQILDADIVLLKSEFSKSKLSYSDLRLKKYIDQVVLHEMGHFLGLDHNFDKGTKSIMGYDDIEAKLFDYDVRAIQTLYE